MEDGGDGAPGGLCIYTLGRFEVCRHGLPLVGPGKQKLRLLDLLKAITAQGPHGAASCAIADLLWPETEGDRAADQLRVALHRLRKLLGDAQAVTCLAGRIRLEAQRCWVDAFCFESLVDLTQAAPPTAARLLDLYQGQFLAADGDRPWLLAQRERLRSKFLRAVEACGADLLRQDAIEQACLLYRRALEVDPLAEAFYRSLMACYLQQQRHVEAVVVYQRCRLMLSSVLGVQPSAEVETLRRRAAP